MLQASRRITYNENTMIINLRAVGMELTPAIRKYVEEKIGGLEKYDDQILNADVDLGLETHHHNKGEIFSCSLRLQLPKDLVKIAKTEKNLYKSVDKVKDHAREVLSARKEKLRDEKRKA